MAVKDLDQEVKDMVQFLDDVEKSNIHPHIDGKTMACALKLGFYAGVKEVEVCYHIKIRHLKWNNDQPIQIDQGSAEKDIPLPSKPYDMQKALVDYLWHLCSKIGVPGEDSPLFPEYFGESGKKKFYRYLNALQISLGYSALDKFKDIRKLGIRYHKDLEKKRLTKLPTTTQFRLTARSVQNAVTGEPPPPRGRKTTIADRMNKVLNYLRHIDRTNDEYRSFMESFVKKKNYLFGRIDKQRSIDAGIIKRLKEKNIEVIRKLKELYDDELKMRSLSPKISSPSKILHMVKPSHMVKPNGEQEKIEKLIWLVDYITVIPISNLEELNIFRDIFFETLDTLAQGTEVKEDFAEGFYQNFYQRNIVFTSQFSMVYDPNKSKLPESTVLPVATRIGFNESAAIGKPDEDLISLLKKCGSEDLEPLASYLARSPKICTVSVDEIAKRIQSVKNIKPFPGVKRLVPYKEVLHYVAEKLGVNCENGQPADLETRINSTILENLWAGLGEEILQALRALRGHEMNCLLARAFWKVQSGTGLPVGKSGLPPFWTQALEDLICELVEKSLPPKTDPEGLHFFGVLQCIAHISMLRQLNPYKQHIRYFLEIACPRDRLGRLIKVPIYYRLDVAKQSPSLGPDFLPMVIEDPVPIDFDRKDEPGD